MCWTGSDHHEERATASSTGTQRESGLVHRFPSRRAADHEFRAWIVRGMQPQMTLAAWSSSRKRPSCFSRTGPSLPAQKQKWAMLSYAKTKGGAPLPVGSSATPAITRPAQWETMAEGIASFRSRRTANSTSGAKHKMAAISSLSVCEYCTELGTPNRFDSTLEEVTFCPDRFSAADQIL